MAAVLLFTMVFFVSLPLGVVKAIADRQIIMFSDLECGMCLARSLVSFRHLRSVG